jgi:hypothetical protein
VSLPWGRSRSYVGNQTLRRHIFGATYDPKVWRIGSTDRQPRVGAESGTQPVSVGGDVVEFDVLGSYVETHSSEGPQALGVRLVLLADQDQVQMPHADVVRVDVYLFHVDNIASGAFERNLWSGRVSPLLGGLLEVPSGMIQHGSGPLTAVSRCRGRYTGSEV